MNHEEALKRGRDVIENIFEKVKNQQGEILKHGKDILEHHAQRRMTSLKNFNSLVDIFPRSELTALYFGASWCPSCLAFTNLLDQSFSDESAPGRSRILHPEDTAVKKDVAIVHVSSDATEEDMKNFLRHNWMAVPFNHPDRSNLKRFFRVCAEREQDDLGVKRQYEIPSLIIIDSETKALVTSNGVHDVQVHGAKAIDEWLKLRNMVTSMHDKYLKEA
jgi:thiol-disulfide isomerase/thioredoxin